MGLTMACSSGEGEGEAGGAAVAADGGVGALGLGGSTSGPLVPQALSRRVAASRSGLRNKRVGVIMALRAGRQKEGILTKRKRAMDESTFNTLADASLNEIEQRLEASGADVDFEFSSAGVFEIEFADGSKMIINRHGSAQEIWVAARSGGFHFRHDGSIWRDSRDGEELFTKLATLLSAQAGEKVQL